ncbi:MAG: hypothetical protein HYW22_00515 [Candidatus Aenigmarchaeota archaeon]|nr:hypothetical protein [Candidatus Aenigmarchaeota archaeon]
MARGTFQGDDINIYLTPDEITNLGFLEIRRVGSRGRLAHPPLEVELVTDGGLVKATIEVTKLQQPERYSDHIKVDRRPEGFYIQIDEIAHDRMHYDRPDDRRHPLAETRYNGSDKVSFWLE